MRREVGNVVAQENRKEGSRFYQSQLWQGVQFDLVVFVLHWQLVVNLRQLQVAQTQAHLQHNDQQTKHQWMTISRLSLSVRACHA